MNEIEYNFKKINLGHVISIVTMIAGFVVFSLNMQEKFSAFATVLEHRLTKMESDISWLKSSEHSKNSNPER